MPFRYLMVLFSLFPRVKLPILGNSKLTQYLFCYSFIYPNPLHSKHLPFLWWLNIAIYPVPLHRTQGLLTPFMMVRPLSFFIGSFINSSKLVILFLLAVVRDAFRRFVRYHRTHQSVNNRK